MYRTFDINNKYYSNANFIIYKIVEETRNVMILKIIKRWPELIYRRRYCI